MIRLTPDAVTAVDRITADHHYDSRSATLRMLLRLGLDAFRAGKR